MSGFLSLYPDAESFLLAFEGRGCDSMEAVRHKSHDLQVAVARGYVSVDRANAMQKLLATEAAALSAERGADPAVRADPRSVLRRLVSEVRSFPEARYVDAEFEMVEPAGAASVPESVPEPAGGAAGAAAPGHDCGSGCDHGRGPVDADFSVPPVWWSPGEERALRRSPRRLVTALVYEDAPVYATHYALECGHVATVVWRESFGALDLIRLLGADPMNGFFPHRAGEWLDGFGLRCASCAGLPPLWRVAAKPDAVEPSPSVGPA